MKKYFFCIIPLIMLIMGCTGGAKPTAKPVENSTANSGGMTLDQALKEAAISIDERIKAGTKIAPLNFNSPHDKFSGYVLDELTANLVDNGKLTVVDRKEVDLIRSEFDFQFSGEVGDDSMQQLGRMLGAQSIISGSLTDMGGFYRIVIRVLNVQNASVDVQYRANIASDNIMAALLTGGKTQSMAVASRQTSSGKNGLTAQVTQASTVSAPVSNKKYEVVNRSLDWIKAKIEAEDSGGHLAVITSAQEQNTIENMVARHGEKKAFWLGGYRDNRDKYVWITNEPMNYTNWAPGEPNGGEQDRMSMYGRGPNFGKWDNETNDLSGSGDTAGGNGYIIEWD